MHSDCSKTHVLSEYKTKNEKHVLLFSNLCALLFLLVVCNFYVIKQMKKPKLSITL